MTLAEVEAAAMALPLEERVALLDALEDSVYPGPDPADIEHSRWIVEEMLAGRMKAVPADEVLAELDRIAGLEKFDPDFVAELNRRIDEAESGTAASRPAEQVFADMKARREARAGAVRRDEPTE